MKRTLLCVLLFLAVPSSALASRPALNLDRADRAAQRNVDEWVGIWQTDFADGSEDFTVTDTQLDPCDRDSSSRASCDVTYSFSDGDECDETIVVSTTHRNRLAVREEDFVCASDD